MHVLALDFDGVLCDSSREVFVAAVDTYADIEPASPLIEILRPLRDDAASGGERFRNDSVYCTFRDLLPLGNRAEDFGVALRAIADGAAVNDQEGYDDFYESVGTMWLALFHRRFYECRDRLRDDDMEGWLRLHIPFPGLAEILRRHLTRTRPAVATAKDRRSIEILLDALGLDGVFAPELILDKEAGIEKTHQRRARQERAGVEFADITFVDDKVNHLQRAAPLGVRPVLARWGFNTPREHERARALGFEVADLATADEVLFKGE
jgi:phosphoglycolate phosphatase-like HAD superfamily hydrolase